MTDLPEHACPGAHAHLEAVGPGLQFPGQCLAALAPLAERRAARYPGAHYIDGALTVTGKRRTREFFVDFSQL